MACNGGSSGDTPADVDPALLPHPAPQISYNIVNQYPHDTGAYTQGLELYKGKMYEGTGDWENSSLRITDYKTGKVLQKHLIGTDKIFGEGITILKNKIYQLTWQSNIVYVYDINNIDKPVQTFSWPYQGWGITNDGTDLIISTGGDRLFFVNATDFKVKRTVPVIEDGVSIDAINELEYINGFVFANVYQKDDILKIDTATGKVVGKLNLQGVIQKNAPGFIPAPGDEVLNGIAYDSTTKKMFVTGKRWPKMFELTFNN
jgi:glutaminyl-peptide cyclotransferase